MANIDTYLNEILAAIYGEEVRSSIVNALKAQNNETENNTSITEQMEKDWDTALSNINTSIKNADTATSSANTAASNANTAADAANAAANSANSAASSANSAASSANTATSKADSATEAAEEATLLANEAAEAILSQVNYLAFNLDPDDYGLNVVVFN